MASGNIRSSTLAQLRTELSASYCARDDQCLQVLLPLLRGDKGTLEAIATKTRQLLEKVRGRQRATSPFLSLLHEYPLSSEEGVALLGLTEALLRTPDTAAAHQLIQDKLAAANWARHITQSDSIWVNTVNRLLMLSSKTIISSKTDVSQKKESAVTAGLRWLPTEVLHKTFLELIKKIANQFIMAPSIKGAIEKINKEKNPNNGFSLDILGESALTHNTAEKHFNDYKMAIEAIGSQRWSNKKSIPGLSIKLSALHPRYEYNQSERVIPDVVERLEILLRQARKHHISITIDAEEADYLELSLDIFERVYCGQACRGWDGFGLAVQAYSKRALPVLKWLEALYKEQYQCHGHSQRIPLRLVKGAYWDSEIKHAQQLGVNDYPVFTEKNDTDIAYLGCARYLLDRPEIFYPQFATHNAQTVCAILYEAGDQKDFEFQRLYGMGEALYQTLLEQNPNLVCRVYAPVGDYQELLPYLIRRLLENGANNSFIYQFYDESTSISELTKHPLQYQAGKSKQPDGIPKPPDIYQPDRINSTGINLAIASQRDPLVTHINAFAEKNWQAKPLITPAAFTKTSFSSRVINSPYSDQQEVGRCEEATVEMAVAALANAHNYFQQWRFIAVEQRARILMRYADLLEENKSELISLCIRETGKTIADGINEVREAIDFARYYAALAIRNFTTPQLMPSVVGEENQLYWRPRGVFLCISPWNFPLAIFSGQITAALAAGNCVLAKPASQSSLIAHRAVQLMHQAGVARQALQFIPGKGAELGQRLCADERLGGVAFTGSTAAAKTINQQLANKPGAIIPLIAETGGQNVMIVDSTAFVDQLVVDVIDSAFNSAGQRCSALRVLYVQEDIADEVIGILKGDMAQINTDNPQLLSTDVGALISQSAKEELQAHIDKLTQQGQLLYACKPSPAMDIQQGHFVLPHLFEIEKLEELEKENFGPVLHVIRYRYQELEQLVGKINDCGYGLTLGIHTRNEQWAKRLAARLNVGNIYINRNMIGAVVGSQPFGGQGLSGTGPKAGGPHYLFRFATEVCVSHNTAAIGGNLQLLAPEPGQQAGGNDENH